jgi:tRNA-splicing ligase RtcB
MDIKKLIDYSSDVDKETMDQMHSVIKNPFVTRASLMPDAHLGYTAPIGSVIESYNAISPAIVGNDIGCGVGAVKTNLDIQDIIGNEREIYQALEEVIPIQQGKDMAFSYSQALTDEGNRIFKASNANCQLGTLGRGNHFLEICYSTRDNCIWVVIHSGSRNFGYQLAQHYMNEVGDKVFAPYSTQVAKDCFNDYAVATQYALSNRTIMFGRTLSVLHEVLQIEPTKYDWDTFINKVHNSVEKKNENSMHFIHRKGATSAKKGELGVIPGNMRDGSYLIKGLGSSYGLESCSHGAGRLMSRKKAKKMLKLEHLKGDMEANNIECGMLTKRDLAESPDAYKDFNWIMELQIGKLLTIKERLLPMINYKGS